MGQAASVKNSDPQRPILQAKGLTLGYGPSAKWTEVVHGIDFSVDSRQTLAIVGESGSGKSTVAKAIVKLIPIKGGQLVFKGENLAPLTKDAFFPYRKKIQMIFQDPSMALNPRRSVLELIEEPLRIHFPSLDRTERLNRVRGLLEAVQLPTDCLDRRPAEFSGGQRQRLLIARALSVEPEILVCDEPVSALDVSIQAKLLNLLRQLKAERHLTLLFISHDLAVVQNFADSVIVMKQGTIVEEGKAADIFRHPSHPYTQMLVEACPQW